MPDLQSRKHPNTCQEKTILFLCKWSGTTFDIIGYIAACVGAPFETFLCIDSRGGISEETAVPTGFNRFGCSKKHHWKPTWAHQLQKWFNVLSLCLSPTLRPFCSYISDPNLFLPLPVWFLLIGKLLIISLLSSFTLTTVRWKIRAYQGVEGKFLYSHVKLNKKVCFFNTHTHTKKAKKSVRYLTAWKYIENLIRCVRKNQQMWFTKQKNVLKRPESNIL
jgi:hypothetical protein